MTAQLAFATEIEADVQPNSPARGLTWSSGIAASTDAPRPRVRELAMSAAWHGGLTREMVTTEGEKIAVVFRGLWSHGFGPDFTGAMIQVGDAAPQTGAVEIHLKASDWIQHGHHLDPRYNSVILHVVSRLDSPETRRADGAIVPTVVLEIPEADLFAIDQELPDIWARLGHSVCAEDVARREPLRLRAALHRLGDQRFSERAARYEGELTIEPLSIVLIRGLFDAFGYSQNREPMRALVQRVLDAGTLARISAVDSGERHSVVRALLLGIAGFLPFSPPDGHASSLGHAEIRAIEARWLQDSSPASSLVLPPNLWTRARSRPANHPVARLVSLANMLAATGGEPGAGLLPCIRHGEDAALRLRELTRTEVHPGIGPGRAISIIASVVLPVAMAYAHHTDDVELEDAISRAWSALPRSEWSRPARRALAQAAGEAPLGPLGERAIQGLLRLDRALCTPRRCYECPIAAEVIRDRQRQDGPAVIQSMLPT